MATRPFTANKIGPRSLTVTWTGLLNTDDGALFDLNGLPRGDISVQMAGVFGVGGTIFLQVNSDGGGITYPISDFTAAASMSFTFGGVRDVPIRPRIIRPVVTAGDGTTNLTCTLNIVTEETLS